jgi:predicted nucleic acid-binding protein
MVPGIVPAELSHELAPESVQCWVAADPDWLNIDESRAGALFDGIHKGEAAAFALASRLHTDLLLMDDRKGVITAERQGLNLTGTLAVLDFAAKHMLLDFAEAAPILSVDIRPGVQGELARQAAAHG